MGFTLLLLLAVSAPSPAAGTPEFAPSTGHEPLKLWNALNTRLPWLRLVPAQSQGVERNESLQLENRRTGVTCSMRILAVKPVPDAGIIASVSRPQSDPMVRSSLSPCVE